MNEKTLNGKKALRVALPVIIGLVLIALITLTVTIVSRPDYNADVNNPNGTYLKLDDYSINNGKVYVNLRYNYGVSEMVAYVDQILLKDITVDRNSEKYLTVKEKLIYGEDLEELTASEKADKLAEYKTKLKIAGYTTDEEVDNYFDLEYRRTVYAEGAYADFIKENGYSAADYESGYLAMNSKKYTDSVDAIVVSFDSQTEALAVLAAFGVDTSNLAADNWINLEKETKRIELFNKISELEAKIEDENLTGAALEQANAEIKDYTNQILAFGVNSISSTVYFTELEIDRIFVDMYNFMNAFFQGGDVTKYYGEDGKLLPKYNILVEDVHYQVVEKDVSVVIDDVETTIKKKFVEIKGDIEEEKINANVKLTYTSAEATALDSKLNTSLFSTLKFGADYDFNDTYTKSPISYSNGTSYFLAILLDKYEAPELEYDFDGDVAEGKVAPSEEILNQIDTYLIDEKFSNDIITQMLLILREDNDLTIYDNFLDSMYKAAWDYLYGTTLAMEDYPDYNLTKKNNKTVAFSFTPENTSKVEVTAQTLFEIMNKRHGPQVVLSLMSSHIVLSNPEFNKLYNAETGEIYNKDNFQTAVETNLKNIKYYFNNGYYASAGFEASYGWENFLHDYLRMEDEKELVLNMSGMEDAYDKFNKTTYKYADVVEEMKKQYLAYHEMSVINLLVTTDYNHDTKPDSYQVDSEKTQDYWTSIQETKAQELLEAVYKEAPLTGKDGLYNQLVEVVDVYNKAALNDEKWGSYKKLGLHVKAEAAATYNNESSLVTEFLDKLEEVYHDIELDGRTGITFDAPYQVDGSFPTEYGYHKIAIAGTTERAHAVETVDKTLGYEGVRDADLALLTEKLYELYVEMQAEDYETNKATVLKDLGFAEDYEMDEKIEASMEKYYAKAAAALEDDNLIDLAFTFLREEAVNSGKFVFTNNSDKEYYLIVEEIVREDLENTIAKANE